MQKNTKVFSSAQLAEAAAVLAGGGLLALPTETVYGLAADACNEEAVRSIYEAKGRAQKKPLSVLVQDMSMVESYCQNIPIEAYRLAEAFWPGPLTLVMSARDNLASTVLAGGSTLGVRCPDHPVTQALLARHGAPVAAPSANLSGEESAKNVAEVMRALDGRIDAVLDGGACSVATESTIVDLTGEGIRILRQGALPQERIRAVLDEERMTVVGITGGTGAGKTTALRALRALGACIIDADAVYHGLTESSEDLRKELELRFGELYTEKGLDRKKLGKIVFEDPAALEDLNQITHHHVAEAVARLLAKAAREGKRLAALDAIALIESNLRARCDFCVAVTAPAEVRVRRIMLREDLPEDYARLRVAAQKGEAYFRANCDYVLENHEGHSAESFEAAALALFRKVLEKG